MTSLNTVRGNRLRLLLENRRIFRFTEWFLFCFLILFLFLLFLETGTHIPDWFPTCYIAKSDLEFLTLLPNFPSAKMACVPQHF